MRKLFIGLIMLISTTAQASINNPSSLSATNTENAALDLCSAEGLMRLVPQLKNSQGKFQIPNPVSHPQEFLAIHTALTNIIEMILMQANIQGNPYVLSAQQNRPLKFQQAWRSAEVALQTNGKKLSFVEENNQFGSFGGISFMSGITPLPQSAGYYYSINKPDGTVPALVYVQPTILSCVNRLNLAAANTAGSWPTPTYALGKKDGDAYLIINKCLDLAYMNVDNRHSSMQPNGMFIAAIQWADTKEFSDMRTNQTSHVH